MKLKDRLVVVKGIYVNVAKEQENPLVDIFGNTRRQANGQATNDCYGT